MACRMLGICPHMIKYVICETYCKLYSISDVSMKKPNQRPNISKYTFKDFPNHLMANKRQFCDDDLFKKVPVS
ncbi:4451_t:CDS:1, partial [Dentiscutata erythropus]